MKIVDQSGKPFKPNPMAELLQLAIPMVLAGESRKFEEISRLEQLRTSCGEKPKRETITFRRFLPYGFKR